MSCRNVLSCSLKIERRIKALELCLTAVMFLWFCQQAMEIIKFMKCYGKAFLVISPLSPRSTTSSSIKIYWAWSFCPPFKRLNQTFTWNFPLLSANMSLQLDDPGWSPMTNTEINSWLNSDFAITFKFKPTDMAKKSLQDSSFDVFFSKLL